MVFMKKYKKILLSILFLVFATNSFSPIFAGKFFKQNKRVKKNGSIIYSPNVKKFLLPSVIGLGIFGTIVLLANIFGEDNINKNVQNVDKSNGIEQAQAGKNVNASGQPRKSNKVKFSKASKASWWSGNDNDFAWKEEIDLNGKMPIIYDERYNIGFFGLEKLHSFDGKKYGKVHDQLVRSGIKEAQFIKPGIVSDKDLELVHTKRYLDSLSSSKNVLKIAELSVGAIYSIVPNFVLQRKLLNPMRRATAGTVLAAKLAVAKNSNFINLGGGYHHAASNEGGGFCFFADINFAVKNLWQDIPELKVMVIDLDAHQGNGHEITFGSDSKTKKQVTIFDIYCDNNYPRHHPGKEFIDYNYPVCRKIKNREYLDIIEKNLPGAIKKSKPDLIIYNAGTDPYEKDPLGAMSLTLDGLVHRDELVFEYAKNAGVPVCMVTSGGYSKESGDIISASINNLIAKNYIQAI